MLSHTNTSVIQPEGQLKPHSAFFRTGFIGGRPMRRHVLWAAMMVALVGWSSTIWAAGEYLGVHDGSAITITSPQTGETVGRSFPLTYVLRKGLNADHAHVYLDGEYLKGFKGTFQDLSSGNHTIMVKVATHDHNLLPESDSVEVTVK